MSVTTLKPHNYDDWASLWRQYLQIDGLDLPEAQVKDTFSRHLAMDGDINALVIRDDQIGKLLGLSHFGLLPSPWSRKAICWMNCEVQSTRAQIYGHCEVKIVP
jgi:hypothetical protein